MRDEKKAAYSLVIRYIKSVLKRYPGASEEYRGALQEIQENLEEAKNFHE